MRYAFVWSFLLVAPAAAQEHPLNHDPYTGWRQPGGFGECCHRQHCRRSSYCPLPDGGVGLMLDGSCIPIPEELIVPHPSPDGWPHICAENDGTVLCVVVPEPKSA
jgi:hypothetical protein